jgi:type II secretory pathway component PulC
MTPKNALLLVNIVLTGLVLWAAAYAVGDWVNTRQSREGLRDQGPGSGKNEGPAQGMAKGLPDYEAIARQDFFRTTKNEPKSPVEGRTDLQVMDLNLELKGTVVGKGDRSRAMIMDKGSKRQDVYSLDDYVAGARIVRIQEDRVVLDVGGREGILAMSEESSPASPPEASPPPAQTKSRIGRGARAGRGRVGP